MCGIGPGIYLSGKAPACQAQDPEFSSRTFPKGKNVRNYYLKVMWNAC